MMGVAFRSKTVLETHAAERCLKPPRSTRAKLFSCQKCINSFNITGFGIKPLLGSAP